MEVIIAIDTSESTLFVPRYYTTVNTLIDKHPDSTLISWNTFAKFVTDKRVLSSSDAKGCTYFDKCLKLLLSLKGEYHLIVTTDGQVYNETVCQNIVETSKLISTIKKVEIHFIGDLKKMNTKIISIFEKIPQVQGFQNGKPMGKTKPIFRLKDLQLENLRDENKFGDFLMEIVSKKNIDKKELRKILKKFEVQILNEYSKEATDNLSGQITNFFSDKEHVACARFIQTKYSNYITDKKKIQSRIQQILNMLDNPQHMYSLENFKSLTDVPVEEITTEKTPLVLEETNCDVDCDIMFEQCMNVCMLIKDLVDENDSILKTNFKKFAECPFELLNHQDLLDRLSKFVEYYKVDLKTYKMLPNKHKSPFTRDKLKGAYVFHNSNTDFEKLILHNSRSISILFGKENKLPGNRYVWNVVFLYAMSKVHPVWKEYKDLLWDEIRYIAENATVYISLSNLINPNIKTKLEIALWYCVNVSPLAFPNSSKNRIRAAGSSLYEFYSDIYEIPEAVSLDLLNTWILWKYLVRNHTRPGMKSEIIAQFFNHKTINDKLVFFTGPVKERCGYLKQFDKELIMKTYSHFQNTEKPSLYDKIDLRDDIMEIKTWLDSLNIKIMVQGDEDEEKALEELSHVKINPKTCHPFVICPKTKKYWKECANIYDIFSESYVRLFRKYCIRYKKFPLQAKDLIAYHSEICLSRERLMIYNESIMYSKMNKILEIFASVMQLYSCDEFLKLTNMYCSESIRLQNE
ncbi:hypothetical protein AVEN_200979-1 [Araneus ventricosus]|uniref:Uncharacterized protein n=1 Tax=Araneus ventricosus TaxID=182803 RepID=A0A4Y2TMN3_ARAVE|nr:hypothetical protein AVEN_200979-1 [Araneus ventricosus]